jgi:hypothetical protein
VCYEYAKRGARADFEGLKEVGNMFGEPVNDAWAEYYKNLPSVPYVDGMKERVKMYELKGAGISPYTYQPDQEIELVSEVFESKEEAEHFARAFEKHCFAKVLVRETYTAGEYIVFGNVHVFSVSANYREKEGHYVFANWA